jgi:hypothetical protein
MLESDPSFARAYDLLGASYWLLGDPNAAHNAYRQCHELTGRPTWFLEAWNEGYRQDGFKGSARGVLVASRAHDDGSISHPLRATFACQAEEPDEALIELNQAIRRRDPLAVMIGTMPWFDCARSDPQFQELLREINWPGLEE